MINTRFDLVPQAGLLEVHKVLTNKLTKYGKDEWRSGISWTSLAGNLQKHLSEFLAGNDYDADGLLHIAHVAEEALLIAEAYKAFPQFDDRIVRTVTRPRIALDIDDCCLDFLGSYAKRYGETNPYWNGDYRMLEHLTELQSDKEFWCNLPLLHKPNFEPACYITSRSIPDEWTKESIQKAGLPCAPVYSVPWNESKVELLKKLKIDILCDDKPANIQDAQAAGIFCYLMDQPHNRWYKVPEHRRITDLNLNI